MRWVGATFRDTGENMFDRATVEENDSNWKRKIENYSECKLGVSEQLDLA